MPHSAVNEEHRNHAKSLRRAMTRAETLLWRYLKAHRIDGLGFRWQAPIGRYIVDLVCHEARIVVELDGETHDFEQQQKRDQVRDAWLATRGYAVLRFTNKDVLSNLEGVVTVIRETAGTRLATPPSLSLPRKGGGNPQTSSSPTATKRAAGTRP
jgi:very-short-patch-repair endonuclease